MEDLSLYFLWSGLVAAGIAAPVYIIYAAAPRLALMIRRPIPAPASVAASVAVGGGAVLGAAAAGGSTAVGPELDSQALRRPTRPARPRTLGGVASFAAWTSVVFGGLGLILRTIALDHAPFSNLFEFSMAFGFAIALVYVLFERYYRTRLLGAFVMPVAFGLYVSALAFPDEGQQTLVPALQNPTLLTIHVSLMILSYAVLAVAFGGAVMHIVQGNDRQRVSWLPTPRRAEELTYRAVLVGFPLLGVGVALGALWANDAWGRYWGWDPKETAALVTWLIFALYLHARGLQPAAAGSDARPPAMAPATPRARRRRRSWLPPGPWIVVLGFAAMLFTYLGVNLWISGLHSYAGV